MAQVTVITTPDLAPGFALAGATVYTASDPATAEHLLRRLSAEVPDSIIALHEPFFVRLPRDVRAQVELVYRPLVVALPDGIPARGEVSRRQLLTEMISRVIGYSLSFRNQDEQESP